MFQRPAITKLYLQNFRSIQNAVITFDNPTILVGKNGTGKSNVLDAFQFLADCMVKPIETYFWGKLRVSSYPLTTHSAEPDLGMRVEFTLGRDQDYRQGYYAFVVRPNYDKFSITIIQEECVVDKKKSGSTFFTRTENDFKTNLRGVKPSLHPSALALPLIGGTVDFAPVVRLLRSIQIYDFEPKTVKSFNHDDPGHYLSSDGSNIASCYYKLTKGNSELAERISHIISAIAPYQLSVTAEMSDHNLEYGKPYLIFTEQLGDGKTRRLGAFDISDGILRMLSFTVVALLQTHAPPLIAFEEPETGVHPGALDTITDLVQSAAQNTQVIITTHSPELLDAKWIQPEHIRVVTWDDGQTRVSPLGPAPIKLLKEHLMGAGELLRANALDEGPVEETKPEGQLFDRIAA